MKQLIAVILISGILPAAAAPAAPSEWQQRLACTSDAFRLCAADIPDHAKIRACMVKAHDQLSDRCRHVFDASIAAGE